VALTRSSSNRNQKLESADEGEAKESTAFSKKDRNGEGVKKGCVNYCRGGASRTNIYAPYALGKLHPRSTTASEAEMETLAQEVRKKRTRLPEAAMAVENNMSHSRSSSL